jgi:hypothetical protein
MATPADQRLLELLDKWLTSLDLHLKYATLDDDSYWKIQTWVAHQRPGRWIIDLARQKTATLRDSVRERIKMGDTKFSDALESMTFLANLVGAQHIERFIPLAEPENERPMPLDPAGDLFKSPPAVAVTGTREMPKFEAPKPPGSAARSVPAPATPTPSAAPAARVERKPSAKPAAKAPATRVPELADEQRDQVIADAARLVHWGRKWYELAELIARMADRPALPEIRRILKDHKAAIEKLAEQQ